MISIIKSNKRVLIPIFLSWILVIILSTLNLYFFKANKHISIKKIHTTWYEIFFHNMNLSILLIVIGIITISIGSLLLVLFQMYIVSQSIVFAYIQSNSICYSLLIILFHGVIEILAISLTFLISTISFRKYINKIYNKEVFFINPFKQRIKIYILIIILFLISSIIESNITNNIAQQFI